MKKDEKTIQGKNSLRNYQFERVQRSKRITHYHPQFGTYYQIFNNFFYTKQCLYCHKEFEARRVDTAFCSQNCQKANLRLRKKKAYAYIIKQKIRLL